MSVKFHCIVYKHRKNDPYSRCDRCDKIIGHPMLLYKVQLTIQLPKFTFSRLFTFHKNCFSKDLLPTNSKDVKIKDVFIQDYTCSWKSKKRGKLTRWPL